MASIRLECRTGRASDSGEAPVRLCISHQGTRRFLSTDVRAIVQHWDVERKQVTSNHHHAAAINARLSQIRSDAQTAKMELIGKGVPLSADRLKDAIARKLNGDDSKGPSSFLDFAQEKQYDSARTRKNHRVGLKKLKRFLESEHGRSDIPVSPSYLTPSLIKGLIRWEKEELGNAQNTIHKTQRTIRRMVNLAIEQGHFPRSEYPYDHVTLKRNRTPKHPLTPEQVDQMRDLLHRVDEGNVGWPIPDTTAHHTLRLWLFQVYAMGMRYGDAVSLQWDEIQEGRLKYQMMKTGEPKNIRIIDPAREILDAYSGREGNHRFVFPLLDYHAADPDTDLNTEEDFMRAIETRNTTVNDALKQISHHLGFNVEVTTHTARHSFVERTLQAGWTLREVQKALGHQDISETEAYVRTLRDDELDGKHESLF